MNLFRYLHSLIKNKIRKNLSQEKRLIQISKLLKVENNKFIDLLPDEFKERFAKLSFISGGCIYSLYNNQTPKDYDFFLMSDLLVKEMRDYFNDVAAYKGNSMSGGLYNGLGLVITENAISIGKYQIITRWAGTPDIVIEEFDFKHNMFYFKDGQIDTLSDFKHLDSKELCYNEKRARDICGTIIRVNRFVQRGMICRNKEMAKMLLKLHEVGFNDRELEILRDSKSDKHFGS
jgi:hypothetical protein